MSAACRSVERTTPLVAIPARTRVCTPWARRIMSRSLPAKALTRFLSTTMSPGRGSTAGWICVADPLATKVAELARAPKMRLFRFTSGAPARNADPDIDDRNEAGPRRGSRPVQGLEQGGRRVGKALHDRVLDVHEEQRGVRHGRSLLPVTHHFPRMPDASGFNEVDGAGNVLCDVRFVDGENHLPLHQGGRGGQGDRPDGWGTGSSHSATSSATATSVSTGRQRDTAEQARRGHGGHPRRRGILARGIRQRRLQLRGRRLFLVGRGALPR